MKLFLLLMAGFCIGSNEPFASVRAALAHCDAGAIALNACALVVGTAFIASAVKSAR